MNWTVGTLVLAAIIHTLIVWKTPWLVNYQWFRELKGAGVKSNLLSHAKAPKLAGKDIVPLDNPDNVSSYFLYDLAQVNLRLDAAVVRDAAYWSVGFADSNANVFKVFRDLDVSGDRLRVVLIAEGRIYEPQADEIVVTAPSREGIVLFRMIVPDRYDLASVDRLRAIKADTRLEVLPLASARSGG